MNRTEIEQAIKEHLGEYGIRQVGVFGSYARGEERPHSDIDIYYKYNGLLSAWKLVHIKATLEQKIGKKIDLVSEASLHNERLKQYIFNDLKMLT